MWAWLAGALEPSPALLTLSKSVLRSRCYSRYWRFALSGWACLPLGPFLSRLSSAPPGMEEGRKVGDPCRLCVPVAPVSGSVTERNQWEARGFLSPCLCPEVSLRAAATPPQLQLPLDSLMVLSPGLWYLCPLSLSLQSGMVEASCWC